MSKILGKPMKRDVIEQDIEKAGPSTELVINQKDVGKVNEQDINEAESSTKPKVKEQEIEEGESSTNPKLEITRQDNQEYAKRCSIFKIPQSLRKIHHKGYEPEVVSIGPYHHKKEHLQMIVEHKHRFLKRFLEEAKEGVNEEVLRGKIIQNMSSITNSYSEKLVEREEELLKIMLLDGCFILMLFAFVARTVEPSPNDPILTTPWILATIRSDLLLLENQVPFILLEILLKESEISSFESGDIRNLAFLFFNLLIIKKEGFVSGQVLHPHLLDLIRKNYIPIFSSTGNSQDAKEKSATSPDYRRLIFSTKTLRLQGIEFKASHDHSSSKEKTMLEVKLDGNELQIPQISFDEFFSSVLLNCVAFEQLSVDCSSEITSYVVFMGCLMNDEADAIYLSEKGIIKNFFGNGNDVSQFFRNISKDIAFNIKKSYLKEVFEGINKYTSNKCNVECATFKRLHYASLWIFLSSFAVVIIIVLTVVQTIFAVLSYSNRPK